MVIARSRTTEPITQRPRGLPIGMIGELVLLVALSTGLAGLLTSGLYLHTGQPAWPPEPLARPGSWPAVIGLVLLVAGALAATAASRGFAADGDQVPTSLLAVSVVALTGTLLAFVRDLATTPFHWGDHAYASVYVVNTATSLVFVGITILMVAAVLVQRLVGVIDRRRMLEVEVVVVHLWWTVLAVGACLAVAHLLPDPGGGP